MTARIQTIRGFRDILPEETPKWWHIEKTARETLAQFGFREVKLPLVEQTALFARSIGEATDIVEKEMYSFKDKSGDNLSLRPEATASVVRMFIQHGLYGRPQAAKLFTIGPMFRRERPQKGRYRQFYQIDAEMFGFEHPLADAELIFMLITILNRLNLKNFELHLNSLGCPECRQQFKEALKDFLAKRHDELCPDCQRRRKLNPLRVFDCKNENCKAIIKDAPVITDYLCGQCQEHFERLKSYLQELNTPYVLDPYLVRGLDYYSRTIFEVIVPDIGAQNAVAGGGRYDYLVEMLGGRPTPAIGFAIGVDRLLPCVPEPPAKDRPVFLALLGEDAIKFGLKWADFLRKHGLWAEMDYRLGSLKSQLNRANRLNAQFCLIIGEEEIKKDKLILRNMDTKQQTEVDILPQEQCLKLIRGNKN